MDVLLVEDDLGLVQALGRALAARGRGLDTCPQAAFADFHEVIRPILGIPDNQIIICGAWNRAHKVVQFEQFNSVVLPVEVLQGFVEPGAALMRSLAQEWTRQGAQPLRLNLPSQAVDDNESAVQGLLRIGVKQLLVHGVTRPQRAQDIETLFVMAAAHSTLGLDRLRTLDVLMPYLHSTYLRVLATEAELRLDRRLPPAPAPVFKPVSTPKLLTSRELEILALIRDGMSNQQAGEALSISALTVKNHVQKLLRKLGATNRAQAVARATALRLLAGLDIDEGSPADARRNEHTPAAPAAHTPRN
jgi:DNA-binding NarL/FixJ family response regulator